MIKSCILLTLLVVVDVNCNTTSTSQMLSKLKYDVFSSYITPRYTAYDYADVHQQDYKTSGVYKIYPKNRVTEGKSLLVYCDMVTSGGGWTVIQRRGDFGSPKHYFYRDWENYKEGFGDVEKDFWLGNDNIFALTNQKLYSVRFDLKDVNQNRSYALYKKFWIDDEDHNYTIHISVYTGNAGDSMGRHNKQAFSTKDRDNDAYSGGSCAVEAQGAWWYKDCHDSNLNGLYHKGKHQSSGDGVNWITWKGLHESLEWTEIKIRPKHF